MIRVTSENTGRRSVGGPATTETERPGVLCALLDEAARPVIEETQEPVAPRGEAGTAPRQRLRPRPYAWD